MPVQTIKLSDLDRYYRPGDIVAFSGKGTFSSLIESVTHSPISHVGIMFDGHGAMLESTTLDQGYNAGSKMRLLSDKAAAYTGRIWYLRLRPEISEVFNHEAFYRFCLMHDGIDYDRVGVLNFGIRYLLAKMKLREDPRRVFCSKLCVMGLQAAGALPKAIDPNRVSPADLVALALYDPVYFQVTGDAAEIPHFNSKTV